MTAAELDAIREHNRPPHGNADRTISALLAEVERLRGLLKRIGEDDHSIYLGLVRDELMAEGLWDASDES